MPELFSPSFITTIEANRTIKDELQAAANAPSRRRRISVTDLVEPRRAYFQRKHPVEIPLDRKQAMWAGTGFHELFGRAVSTEEFVEQYVEVDGVVGKIDVFDRSPVELKTSGSMPRHVRERPSYIDQLGMYCAMVGKTRGQLIICKRAEYGRPAALATYWIAFRDLNAIRREMAVRRDLIAEALEKEAPADLPRCEWMGRNCDYEKICGCSSAPVLDRVVPVDGYIATEDPDANTRYLELIAQAPPAGDYKLNHLVFPRKAFFERMGDPAEEPEERMGSMQRFGFQIALEEALHYGVRGAFKGVPVSLRGLRGLVRTYKDVPTMLRVVKRRELIERKRLPQEQPHYFDRLAFECALSERPKGRLILYYPDIESPDEKFMVYDLHFRDIDGIRAEADRRLTLLESGAPLDQLPPCPTHWMPKYCGFRDRCGCQEAWTAPGVPGWPF